MWICNLFGFIFRVFECEFSIMLECQDHQQVLRIVCNTVHAKGIILIENIWKNSTQSQYDSIHRESEIIVWAYILGASKTNWSTKQACKIYNNKCLFIEYFVNHSFFIQASLQHSSLCSYKMAINFKNKFKKNIPRTERTEVHSWWDFSLYAITELCVYRIRRKNQRKLKLPTIDFRASLSQSLANERANTTCSNVVEPEKKNRK